MNLPTKITVFRIGIVPILWFILLTSFFTQSQKMWIALVLFVIASMSDFLDGYLARKLKQVTALGKFLDPIADKVLVNSILIYLATIQRIPLICVLIMVSRDTLVDALRMSASSKNIVVSAQFLGKLKTVLQMVAIICALIMNLVLPFVLVMIYLATIVSVLSGLQYFFSLKSVIFKEN